MTRVYYKEALGAIVVFDLSRPATYDAVVKWKRDIDEKVSLPDGTKIPVILLANKKDLASISSLPVPIDQFAKDHGFTAWFETSAKENHNIEEACRTLVQKILDYEESNSSRLPSKKTTILSASDSKSSSQSCC